MAIFLSELTSKFLYQETTSPGQAIDSIGNKNSEVGDGVIRNGDSYTLDGLFDDLDWVFGSTPFTPSNDFTGYLDVIVDDNFDGIAAYWLAPEEIVGELGPLVRFNAIGATRQFAILSHGSAGFAIAIIPIGRLLNLGERVVIGFSYSHATKIINLAIVSDDLIDPLEGSATDTGTVALNWTSPTEMRLFKKHQTDERYAGTINESGFIEGVAKSIEDLEDTIAEVLNPTDDKGTIIPAVFPTFLPTFFNPF